MEPTYWQQRWANNQIGFHQDNRNTLLDKFLARLEVPRGGRIFVPLCGKGVEMVWLAGQGHRVIGVEISPIAVEAFFAEHDLVVQREQHGAFIRWCSGPIEILCGDFFDLTSADLTDVAAVYDRAALIALPEALRNAYAHHMAIILPDAVHYLLLTFEYPPEQMQGPPFSVDAVEVQGLFSARCTIEALEGREALSVYPHLKNAGLTRLQEHAFLLRTR